MKFNIVSSGSKGNCTLIKYKDSVICIDMGISQSRFEDGLKEINSSYANIKGFIFTHAHTDHISGIRFFSPKLMYATEGTLPSSLSHIIKYYETFTLGEFEITPLPTSHDAKNSCGFHIKAGDETLVYLTDLGCFDSSYLEEIKNPTYLIIESNHDIKLELHTNRPYELKQRILSEKGHLCNEDSAIASKDIVGPDTKQIVLAHLSEEANTPNLALATYRRVFAYFDVDFDKYNVVCANQHTSLLGGQDED